MKKTLTEWLRQLAIEYKPNIDKYELDSIFCNDTNLYSWEEAKIEISKIKNGNIDGPNFPTQGSFDICELNKINF